MRLYEGSYYRADELSPLVRYIHCVGKDWERHFSMSPDEPIHAFTAKQLRLTADSMTYATIAQAAATHRKELSFDFYALNAKVLGHELWGGGLEFKFYPRLRWATGLTLSGSGKAVSDTFGFSIKEPRLQYLEAGWINQYDLWQNKYFRLGINLTNGFAMATLRDNSQTQKVRSRYGEREVPKRIATNYFYLLQPGLDLSYKVLSNRHNPDFFVNMKARYSKGFGRVRFGEHSAPSTYWFGVGLSLIGFDR
ncbi:hypothetical protein GCM10023184_39240 [Flaviaesturariibacter amylovorans]|uniref:DUF1207 domain-containing protein n=1 Tax=Flaviaesturariibacter amylovorans TaxID=1084520 RepID=A0ABP8HLQ8_9BACT